VVPWWRLRNEVMSGNAPLAKGTPPAGGGEKTQRECGFLSEGLYGEAGKTRTSTRQLHVSWKVGFFSVAALAAPPQKRASALIGGIFSRAPLPERTLSQEVGEICVYRRLSLFAWWGSPDGVDGSCSLAVLGKRKPFFHVRQSAIFLIKLRVSFFFSNPANRFSLSSLWLRRTRVPTSWRISCRASSFLVFSFVRA
jgi:hypothetical protein